MNDTIGRLTFTKVLIFFLLLGGIYFLGPFRMDIQEMRMATFTAGGYVLDEEGSSVEEAEVVLSLEGADPSHLDELFRIAGERRINGGSMEGFSGPGGEFLVETKRKYEVRRGIFPPATPGHPFKTMVLAARKEGYRQSSVAVDISAWSPGKEKLKYAADIIIKKEDT